MTVPIPFTREFLKQHSGEGEGLYSEILDSGEPYRSLARKSFHTSARLGYRHTASEAPDGVPHPGLDLDDETLYYNTAGEAQDYWRGVDLPEPRLDIRELRRDLRDWGYCLIDQALSADQLARMKQRLDDQAAGEQKAGIASWMGTDVAPGEVLPRTQFLHCLINKGEQFVQCVEHDPQGVQAGPLIEQLLSEAIGSRFLMSSFIAIITQPYNQPQGLHQDQAIAPIQEADIPLTCNTMFIMDDVTAENGGTLVVPGSHRLLSGYRTGQPVTEALPPAINLTAPAGTVMIFEGRLLHGTGVNRSNATRTILVMNSIKPFMRQQEIHLMSTRPELLQEGSAKFLYRIGARPFGLGGIEGAWNGDYLVDQRLLLEGGGYVRVGELSPDSSAEELGRRYAYRQSGIGHRQAPSQPHQPVDPVSVPLPFVPRDRRKDD